jgi:hypothetical protein
MFQSASVLSNRKGMGMGMGMGFGKGHAIWRAERALAADLVCTILAREVKTVLDLFGWPEIVALYIQVRSMHSIFAPRYHYL